MKLHQRIPISLGIIILLYFASRIYNLTLLPIFTDESIYIYWAKIIATTHSQYFISLTDGKPPLLIWIIAVFLKLLPSSWYLIAGRLPSVIFGLISLLGIYKLTKIFSKSIETASIAALLYVLNPFLLMYDRLALYDAMLTSMLLWSVICVLKLAETKELKFALTGGIILGLAFLSKPPAVIYWALIPIIYVLFLPSNKHRNWLKKIVLILIPLIISQGMNNIQRFSKVYYLMEGKNQQFTKSISDLLRNPLELTFGNLHGFFSWLIPYSTWPIFALAMIALAYVCLKQTKRGAILFLLWFFPILVLATVGKEIFPRYILFTTPYLIIPIAILMGSFQKKKTYALIVLSLLLIPTLHFDYLILTEPSKAPLPDSDYHQLVSEHPSGFGLSEIFTFIRDESKSGPLNLEIQGTFGLYPYAFNLEFWENSNVHIIPRWPLSAIDEDILKYAKTTKTYILLKEHDEIPANLPLRLVLRATKPGGKYPILLTQLKEDLKK